MRSFLMMLALSGARAGFVAPFSSRRASLSVRRPAVVALAELPTTPQHEELLHDAAADDATTMTIDPAMVMLGVAALAAFQPEAAMAKGGEFGIFEGRIVSLAHPTVMVMMYAASAWAGFTGLQWRRLREIGGEITTLKAELKPLKAKVEAAGEEGPPALLTSQVADLKSKIDEMTSTRKELADGSFKDKHYQVGSVVLGLGTSFAIEGPVNTFIRAQKLFPGPHLYAGAGIVVAWAMAASLVPLMGKGKDWARTAHISFNVLAIGLFTWQLPTGWEIAQKVIKFTKFP